MALAFIPPPRQPRVSGLDRIGFGLDSLTRALAEQELRQKQEGAEQALAQLLAGKPAATPTAAQLDPTRMTVGSRAGTLAAPATPGLLPGVSHEDAMAIALSGIGPQAALAGLERRYAPKPPKAPETRNYVTTDAEGNAIRVTEQFNTSTGQWEQVARPGPAFAPPAQTNVENIIPGAPAQEFIDIKDVPHRVLRDAAGNVTGVEPLAGTDPALERQAAADKAAARQQQKVTALDSVIVPNIALALEQSEKGSTTGAAGQFLSFVGGTDAHDLNQTLATIEANIGFAELQQMRDNSPTGGALGQISDGERAALNAVKGSLKQSQSREQLQHNLMRLHNVLNDIVHGAGAGPDRFDPSAFGGDAAPPQPAATEDYGEGEIVRNPETGEAVILRNGQWMPWNG
jgi:hypothetical protein